MRMPQRPERAFFEAQYPSEFGIHPRAGGLHRPSVYRRPMDTSPNFIQQLTIGEMSMKAKDRFSGALRIVIAAAAVSIAGCADMGMSGGQNIKVSLDGKQESPPVATSATGSGTIKIASDKSVSGSVTTTGVDGTVAHIHQGAGPGKNGPVIIPLNKTSANEWTVPPGAKLTDAQYDSFKSGGLYVNVHSAANKGGEIRGDLKP